MRYSSLCCHPHRTLDGFKHCQNNQPDWSERKFIKRLIDILSFGVKPLYRNFFAKEILFSKKIEQPLLKEIKKNIHLQNEDTKHNLTVLI